VELEVLRALEKRFNSKIMNKIPIKAFFDLIVGTRYTLFFFYYSRLRTNKSSTGGIISLVLAVKNWPLETAIEQFIELCDKAFTPREFHGILGFDHAARISHGSKYKTKPLHNCLKDNLGEDLLFGGVKHGTHGCNLKVAVTSTDEAGRKAIVISNYSRGGETVPNWDFHRPDDPKRELKVWEAAAATSAAAPYFKAYRNEKSGRTYFDGAFYNNNPVRVAHRERRLLWPDVADKNPDVFLSIGTGQNQKKIEREIRRDRPGVRRAASR
jgi:patatin-like phospholipase/acyl hydrolase